MNDKEKIALYESVLRFYAETPWNAISAGVRGDLAKSALNDEAAVPTYRVWLNHVEQEPGTFSIGDDEIPLLDKKIWNDGVHKMTLKVEKTTGSGQTITIYTDNIYVLSPGVKGNWIVQDQKVIAKKK